MSWDADLWLPLREVVLVRNGGATVDRSDGARLLVGSWNYTHNCSSMIYATLKVVVPGWEGDPAHSPEHNRSHWYDLLDGASGADGAELLDRIVNCLMEAPEMFREMNPPNGWGDYDSLLDVLSVMRDAGRAHPTAIWETSG